MGRLPEHEPHWLYADGRTDLAEPDAAATFLQELPAEDRALVLLSYGMGLRVGPVSQALQIDPALVVWRLQLVFARWTRRHPAGQPSTLERAVVGLLRGTLRSSLPAPAGCSGWTADALVHELNETTQTRLAERLAPEPAERAPTGGVGMGVGVLVLAVALGFLGFGIVRDVDPMWRGESLMQQYEYTLAREAFLKVGTVAADTRIVLCLLAEGSFSAALSRLEDPEVRSWFRKFAPGPPPRPLEEVDPTSRALLPRGLTTNVKPTFVVRSGPPSLLEVQVGGRRITLELPDTRGGPESFVVPWPTDWPALTPGRVIWRVNDGNENVAMFDVADREFEQRVRDRNWRVLTRDVPQRAQLFLRAHHFLNEGLLVQAGWQFARLAEAFPAEPYPRQQIWTLAQALGVDPTALLR